MAQPYVVPDLYRPYPARLNVNIQAARACGREWAKGVGMLAGQRGRAGAAWSEEEFDSMDTGLLGAYAHPDASASELELLTQWYTWLFFTADRFRRDLRDGRQGRYGLHGRYCAAERAERLARFLDGKAPPADCPRSASEAGLADLWPRTAATAPEHLLDGFAAATRALIVSESGLQGMPGVSAPHPLRLLSRRRESGAAVWAMQLVAVTCPEAPPGRVLGARRFASLRACFSDAAHLVNDLYSYRRETEDEGALDNAVSALEYALGVPPQEAAERVNGLRTARMRRFEEMSASEAPAWLADHDLSPGECAAIADYLRGLQDWQAGIVEWHQRSGRYRASMTQARQTGQGAAAVLTLRPAAPSAARPPTFPPSSLGHPFRLPPFDLPWAHRINPHVEAARKRARRWARGVGLISTGTDASTAPVWTEHTFTADDVPLLAALTLPDATEERLCRAALWNVCLMAVDDHFASATGPALNDEGELAAARAFVSRLPALMPLTDVPCASRVPAPPRNRRDRIEAAVADLWRTTSSDMPEALRRRFRSGVVAFARSHLWELDDMIRVRTLDPVDHLETRRTTSRADLSIALMLHASAEGSHSSGLQALLGSALLHPLHAAFADTVGIRNDVHSYRKETEEEDGAANGVVAIRRFLDCTVQEAVDLAYALFTERVADFRSAEADLPSALDRTSFDAPTREAVHRHVEALKTWMAGDNEWYRRTDRYNRPRRRPYLLPEPHPLHPSRGPVDASYRRPLTL